MILSIFILIVVIYALIKGVNHNLLTLILIVTGINVLLTEILIAYKLSIKFNTNIYFIANNFLWIQIITQYFDKRIRGVISFSLCVFVLFSLSVNNVFNDVLYTYFVLTSVFYIVLFFIISTKNLKEESITFFQSKDFTLIFSPVLFFLGMSFIFGFKSTIFSNTYLFASDNFKGFHIYQCINFIVNLVYYSLIGYYAFKSRKA